MIIDFSPNPMEIFAFTVGKNGGTHKISFNQFFTSAHLLQLQGSVHGDDDHHLPERVQRKRLRDVHAVGAGTEGRPHPAGRLELNLQVLRI